MNVICFMSARISLNLFGLILLYLLCSWNIECKYHIRTRTHTHTNIAAKQINRVGNMGGERDSLLLRLDLSQLVVNEGIKEMWHCIRNTLILRVMGCLAIVKLEVLIVTAELCVGAEAVHFTTLHEQQEFALIKPFSGSNTEAFMSSPMFSRCEDVINP